MAYEMSIEVLDGDVPAELWMEARGDVLVEVALECQVVERRWQHFGWGTVLEIVFPEEATRSASAPARPSRPPSTPCPTGCRG